METVPWANPYEFICSKDGAPRQIGNATDGSTCAQDFDCDSRVCGKENFSAGAGNICCPQGKKYNLPVPWGYTVHTFCGNLPEGEVCGDDRLCATGRCVQGKCSADLQPDEASCGKNSDCASRSCAKGSFAQNAGKICCPNGERYKLDVDYTYEGDWFCGNLPLGTACGNDRMCESGLCDSVSGQCVSSARQGGATCGKDSDCVNGTCARSRFNGDNPELAPMVCCEGGDSVLLHFPGGYIPGWYCDDVPRPIRAHCVRHEQ